MQHRPLFFPQHWASAGIAGAAVDNKPLLIGMHSSATCCLQEDVARQTTLRNFPNYTTYALDYRCGSYNWGK